MSPAPCHSTAAEARHTVPAPLAVQLQPRCPAGTSRSCLESTSHVHHRAFQGSAWTKEATSCTGSLLDTSALALRRLLKAPLGYVVALLSRVPGGVVGASGEEKAWRKEQTQ